VVGGGNVAIDAARTALRLGARETVIIYRRTEAEMPAAAGRGPSREEEGLILELLTSPERIIGRNGHAIAVECVRMEQGEPDTSGRPAFAPKKGSEFLVKADTVIHGRGYEHQSARVAEHQ